MTKADLPAVAVIADTHCHDIESHYDWDGITLNSQQLTLRSWADTRRSSRVFNESKAALELALHDIYKRGIKHVVLLGDYSDDGQIEATERTVEIFRRHRDQYGTNFFAITGNHDAFGPFGKHQSTRFVKNPRETVLVTSDPKVAATEPESSILTPKMYCEGVPVGISRMSEFGLFRQSDYLYWESPFGQSDAVQEREYIARSADGLQTHKLVDASYLVEPENGLWLLMIDANVFEPRNGQHKPTQKKAFLDSSDAGWNSVLRNRPHLIDWITDVCTRAKQTGKTLIAFSHYPVIDPFVDHENSAGKLFGDNEMLRRKPELSVSETLLKAGLRLHFSGHLHVSALSQRVNGTRKLEDCAVPSLAAFPSGYKVVHAHTDDLSIDTIQLSTMPLDSHLMAYYREENSASDEVVDIALDATNYGEFLYRRMHSRVIHHYLEKEWPKDIAHSLTDKTTIDLALLMLARSNGNTQMQLTDAPSVELVRTLELALFEQALSFDDLAGCSMIQLVTDWYCLRHAGYLARACIHPDRFRIYMFLADSFGDIEPIEESTPQAFFAIFLGMLKSSIRRSDPIATRERYLSA